MRVILAAAIGAVIENIAKLGVAEPDAEKRKEIVRQLAEDAIEGINDIIPSMGGCLYDGEHNELVSTIVMLRKAYGCKPNNN